MKKLLSSAALVALAPGIAGAVGLDRSGQSVSTLFEETGPNGGYVDFTFAHVDPSVSGNDIDGGFATGGVANTFDFIGISTKVQFNDKLSFVLIGEQPYGSAISYPVGRSLELGGTEAFVDSTSLTGLLQYQINDNFSVHGGLRWQNINARVALNGEAFLGLSGYAVDLKSDGDLGFVVGGAFEIPRFAARVAVTYFSGTDHKLPTTETLNGAPANLVVASLDPTSVTKVETPEAINVEFQTGLNERTLLFGNFRYAMYDDVVVSPILFDTLVEAGSPGTSITDIEDGINFNIGIGRRLTDKLSASISYGFETEGDDSLVSPLAPTNGSDSVSIGVSYDLSDAFNISGGVRYTWLGDAQAETGTPDTAQADFDNNNATSIGLKASYKF